MENTRIDQPIDPNVRQQMLLRDDFADLTDRLRQNAQFILNLVENPWNYDLIGLFRLLALRRERKVLLAEQAAVRDLIMSLYAKVYRENQQPFPQAA